MILEKINFFINKAISNKVRVVLCNFLELAIKTKAEKTDIDLYLFVIMV